MSLRTVLPLLFVALSFAYPPQLDADLPIRLTGPKSTDCPSPDVEDVMNHPVVQQGLAEAWSRSKEGTPEEHEEGGYIVHYREQQADGSYRYWVQVQEAAPGTESHVEIGNPPRGGSNARVVASFHTHPGPAGEADYVNDEPSNSDILASAKAGIPGIVRYGQGDDTSDFAYGFAFQNGSYASDFNVERFELSDFLDATTEIREPADLRWECPDAPPDPPPGGDLGTVRIGGTCGEDPSGELTWTNNSEVAVDFSTTLSGNIEIVDGGSGTAAPGESVTTKLETRCGCKCGGESETWTEQGTVSAGEAAYEFDVTVTCAPDDCGSSVGDPNLTSFDGLYFGFHGAGEYTLFETTEGERVTAQVRQVPASIESLTCSSLTLNAAVALQADGHRVAVYADRAQPVWLNGAPFELGDEEHNADGLRIRSTEAGEVLISTSSGEVLRVHPRSWHLNIFVHLPPERQGQTRGLLGSYDGDASNDITTSDGVTLEPPIRWTDLHSTFGDSWRISPDDSLFDYEAGETSETYQRPDFPDQPFRLKEVAETRRQEAQATCEAAGITNPAMVERCMMDVICTGSDDFASDHSAATEPTEVPPVLLPETLTGWTAQGAATENWVPRPEGNGVELTRAGANPELFVSAEEYLDIQMSTRMMVETNGDGDHIGLVFGYRSPVSDEGHSSDSYDMYLFSWNESARFEGYLLARVQGTVPHVGFVGDHVFWEQQSTPEFQVLATNYGNTLGWRPDIEYTFDVLYTADRLEIRRDGETIFDLTAAEAGEPFQRGRIGFYSHSQNDAHYYDLALVEGQP